MKEAKRSLITHERLKEIDETIKSFQIEPVPPNVASPTNISLCVSPTFTCSCIKDLLLSATIMNIKFFDPYLHILCTGYPYDVIIDRYLQVVPYDNICFIFDLVLSMLISYARNP